MRIRPRGADRELIECALSLPAACMCMRAGSTSLFDLACSGRLQWCGRWHYLHSNSWGRGCAASEAFRAQTHSERFSCQRTSLRAARMCIHAMIRSRFSNTLAQGACSGMGACSSSILALGEGVVQQVRLSGLKLIPNASVVSARLCELPACACTR